jgi:TPM domain
MSYRRRIRVCSAHVLAWGLLAGTALAVAPEIRDQGKFFSPEAIKKADEQIREIYRKHNLDLLIEAYNTLPGGDVEKLKAMDAKERNALFVKWVKERTKERVVHGIYIVITKEPRHLTVGRVGRGEEAFSGEFRRKVYDAMVDEFKRGRFDEGLQAAVRLVEQHLGKK